MHDAVADFRQRRLTHLGRVVAWIVVPVAPLTGYQAWSLGDSVLGVAALGYAAIGLFLFNELRQERVNEARFVGSTVGIGLIVLACETPMGTSHLLGIVALIFMVLGLLTSRGAARRRWVNGSAVLFPATLLGRELYRPHPLLSDPLELWPQALAGGLMLWGLGNVVAGLVDVLEDQVEAAR